MATYKDFSGSSSYYDEILNRLKSGDASIKTTAQSKGYITFQDPGVYYWVPYSEQPGSPEVIPTSDLNKYYDPVTERYESTKQVSVSPYIDLGNKPIAGMTEWPVQDLGGGKYQLSVMNSGESGYSNVVLNADNTGKVNITDNTQAFFQPYKSSSLFSDVAPLALAFALPSAGAALGSALGTSAAVGTALAGAGLQAAQGGSVEDIAKGAALGSIGGQIGSSVAGLTDSAALGQLAGGTSSGLLSGKDLETSLTGAALNTGSQQLASSLLTPTAIPTPQPLTDNYSVNADYGLSAPATSGLGLKATLAPLDMSNPYSFDTTLAATGGLGLNFNKAISAGNIGAMGGGQGLLGVGTDGKTLSEIGSAYQNNLTNTQTGQPLGQELQNLVTGAEAYSTDPNDLTGTPDKALSNLLGKLLMATVSNTSGTGTTASQNPFGSLFGSLLGGAGALYQGKSNTEADRALAEQLRQAGQTAQQQAQFKPVGITTRFGTSQFQIDPTTGQLTSAGYTTAPEISKAQESLMGLGAGYLAQTPEQVAADYMARQQNLLAPSRERQLAQLQNQLYQTGRGGLSVGATGARPSGAAGLMASSPEMEAYYNALAQQDAALAAQAQQAGQQQVGFGAGLFGQAGQLEQLAQQPLSLSTQLANLAATSGYRAGSLGLGANAAAARALQPANQYNPYAQILSGAGTSPLITSGLGSLFGNTALGKSLRSYLSGLNADQLNTAASDYIYANPDITPQSTFSGGGADLLDEETRALLGL